MTPYYSDESVTLYHGSAWGVLPLLDRQFDLVVADPPYGETSLTWDTWPKEWPTDVTDYARSMWCFGSMRMFLDHAAEFQGWKFSQDVVWEKHNGSSLANDRFSRVHEHATFWYRGDWASIYHDTPTTNDATARVVRKKGRPAQWTGAAGPSTYVSHDGGPRLMRSVMFARSMHGQSPINETEKPVGILEPLITYACPVGGLYHYSSDDRDLSNARDYDEFFQMYEFVVREKLRVTVPGRCSAVHTALVPDVASAAFSSYIDFPGDVIRLHQRLGWKFVGRHVIWKEPLAVRRRTMQKNLAHMTIVNDGTDGGVASPDELLVFRKPGKAAPVEHPNGLTGTYAGAEVIPADLLRYRAWDGDQKLNRYSHWIWRRYASSVWDDVRIDRVLPFRDAKDEDDEKHVHPLQLDVIERFIDLRTSPGERVLTPFMGVGSEVFAAVSMGRFGIGAELKPSYYSQAVRNLAAVDVPLAPVAEELFDEASA